MNNNYTWLHIFRHVDLATLRNLRQTCKFICHAANTHIVYNLFLRLPFNINLWPSDSLLFFKQCHSIVITRSDQLLWMYKEHNEWFRRIMVVRFSQIFDLMLMCGACPTRSFDHILPPNVKYIEYPPDFKGTVEYFPASLEVLCIYREQYRQFPNIDQYVKIKYKE